MDSDVNVKGGIFFREAWYKLGWKVNRWKKPREKSSEQIVILIVILLSEWHPSNNRPCWKRYVLATVFSWLMRHVLKGVAASLSPPSSRQFTEPLTIPQNLQVLGLTAPFASAMAGS